MNRVGPLVAEISVSKPRVVVASAMLWLASWLMETATRVLCARRGIRVRIVPHVRDDS